MLLCVQYMNIRRYKCAADNKIRIARLVHSGCWSVRCSPVAAGQYKSRRWPVCSGSLRLLQFNIISWLRCIQVLISPDWSILVLISHGLSLAGSRLPAGGGLTRHSSTSLSPALFRSSSGIQCICGIGYHDHTGRPACSVLP